MSNCSCCEQHLKPLFSGIVLQKYNADYLICPQCGFITIASPSWLTEAYSEAITSLDVGLVNRNLELSKTTIRLLESLKITKGNFLDWAGGFGLFTRLMRDQGFHFYHHDPYCQNLFAQHLSYSTEKIFQLITAFEFLEHTSDPFQELESLFQMSDSILFSTVLRPKSAPVNNLDWWYFAPECGQHISFFTEEALKKLASRFQARCFSDGNSLHLITKNSSITNPFTSFQSILHKWITRIALRFSGLTSRTSLIDQDYQNALGELRKKKADTK